MKFTSKILAGLAAGAVALTAGVASAQETVTLRMGTWLPPQHHMIATTLKDWIASVDEASDGRIQIKVDPAPIGGPPAQYDLVRAGASDLVYHVAAYTPGPFEILRAIELPFLSTSAEAGSQAAWDWYERNIGFGEELEDVKVITLFVHGPGAIHTKKPIATLEDLADVKLRVGGGGVRMSEALGAIPVAMPASQAYEAISKGVADGAMFPYESIKGFRLGELVDYHLSIPGGLYTTPFVIMMNQAKYDAMPADLQAALDEAGGINGAKLLGRGWDAADAAGLQVAIDGGGVVTTLSDAELARWSEQISFMEADWIGRANERGLDGAALLEDLKATFSKYNN